MRAQRPDGLDDSGVKHKSHLCALKPRPQQMCDSDCCSECSRQPAAVNAEHLERRCMSSTPSGGPANQQNGGTKTQSNEMLGGCPVTPSNPHSYAFHHINPNLFLSNLHWWYLSVALKFGDTVTTGFGFLRRSFKSADSSAPHVLTLPLLLSLPTQTSGLRWLQDKGADLSPSTILGKSQFGCLFSMQESSLLIKSSFTPSQNSTVSACRGAQIMSVQSICAVKKRKKSFDLYIVMARVDKNELNVKASWPPLVKSPTSSAEQIIRSHLWSTWRPMSREWLVWNLPVVVWLQSKFKSHKDVFQKQIGLNRDTTTDMICMSVIYNQSKYLCKGYCLFFPINVYIFTFGNKNDETNGLYALKLPTRQVPWLWRRGSEMPTEPFLDFVWCLKQ